MRSTRIACTIGPNSFEDSSLLALYREDMIVAPDKEDGLK